MYASRTVEELSKDKDLAARAAAILEDWDDPNCRFLAAMDGYFLEELIHDESWLVRKAARKALTEQELCELGENFSEIGEIDISVIVYELYKQDWLNQHTTPELRLERIREWGRIAGMQIEGGQQPDNYEHWLEEESIFEKNPSRYYLTYSEFCGYLQPSNMGPYHDEEYVAKLLGYDEQLLKLYEADINDTVGLGQPNLTERLDAAMRQSASQSASTSIKIKDGSKEI